MVEIKEEKNLEIIRDLWGAVNRNNQMKSRHFQHLFINKSFDALVEQVKACEDYRLEVVYLEGRPLGFCLGSNCNKLGKINEHYIHDDLRGNGLGSYLFNRMLLWLQTQECEEIRLEIHAGNEEMISYYQKLGFRTERYMLRLKGD